MILFLLSGCSAWSSALSVDDVGSSPQASVFYCYDKKTDTWNSIGDRSSLVAAEQLYVDAAVQAVTEDLMEQLSYTKTEAETLLAEGGLSIYLCMDAQQQSIAEAACAAHNGPSSESGKALQSSAVLLDSKTGQVLALAGDTQALHIPGSALAPLSVYAPALETGSIIPETMVRDQPNEHKWPVNPSGVYHDTITVTDALSSASCCVPVWILDQYLTLDESAQFVQDKFMIPLVLDRTVDGRTVTDLIPAGLALGGLTDGVSTLDMAAAYSVFARGGEYAAPILYTKVIAQDGTTLLNSDAQLTRVLTEETAAAMSGMLKETAANGVGQEATLEGQEIAGLPGESPSRKDLWFVGYTPEYTAAVWCGYASHERLTTPVNPAMALWKQVMESACAALS